MPKPEFEYVSHETVLKDNVLRIAEHHLEHCDGAECNISLSLLAELLTKANITLTQEERSKLM